MCDVVLEGIEMTERSERKKGMLVSEQRRSARERMRRFGSKMCRSEGGEVMQVKVKTSSAVGLTFVRGQDKII